jgi:hypothetical protein
LFVLMNLTVSSKIFIERSLSQPVYVHFWKPDLYRHPLFLQPSAAGRLDN